MPRFTFSLPFSHTPWLGLSGIIAAGPFTVTDNLRMAPLYDLLSIVSNEKPHILLLVSCK